MSLIVVMVSWVYAYVKTGQIVCFKYMQFIKYQLYLNKAIFFKNNFLKEQGKAITTIYKDIVVILRGLYGIFMDYKIYIYLNFHNIYSLQ